MWSCWLPAHPQQKEFRICSAEWATSGTTFYVKDKHINRYWQYTYSSAGVARGDSNRWRLLIQSVRNLRVQPESEHEARTNCWIARVSLGPCNFSEHEAPSCVGRGKLQLALPKRLPWRPMLDAVYQSKDFGRQVPLQLPLQNGTCLGCDHNYPTSRWMNP